MSGYSDRVDPVQRLENEQWRLRWLRRLRVLRIFGEQSIADAEESVRRLEQEQNRQSKESSRITAAPNKPSPGKMPERPPSRNKSTGRKASKRRASR
jgi:hypothetical protein